MRSERSPGQSWRAQRVHQGYQCCSIRHCFITMHGLMDAHTGVSSLGPLREHSLQPLVLGAQEVSARSLNLMEALLEYESRCGPAVISFPGTPGFPLPEGPWASCRNIWGRAGCNVNLCGRAVL